MTEYTSWDNYVKEQQCKIELDMIPLTDYTTWRYQTDNTLTIHAKDQMDMDRRVKDLEKSYNFTYLSPKIEGLATKIDYDRIILDNFASSIDELRKKVKDLEDQIKLVEDLPRAHNQLAFIVREVRFRLEKLEDFEREHKAEFHVAKGVGHIYAADAIKELQKKVKDLEESNKRLWNNINSDHDQDIKHSKDVCPND